MAVPNSNYNNLMSERDPKLYAAMHSNVAPAFTLSNIVKNELIMNETIELMEQRLSELSQKTQQVDLGQWLNFLAWDLLGEVMFSSRFGFLDEGQRRRWFDEEQLLPLRLRYLDGVYAMAALHPPRQPDLSLAGFPT